MRFQSTSIKRITALLLSILMIVTILPGRVTALAADEPEILSFESGNPVSSFTYLVGEELSSVDLPSQLSAVVRLTEEPQQFAQTSPESAGAYTPPDQADALYEADVPVIYTFATAAGTEYRVYGEVGGRVGWFACDATGNIFGYVENVPVSWDLSAVNMSQAGTYECSAGVANYIITCEAPSLMVQVSEPEDGNTPVEPASVDSDSPIVTLDAYYQAGDAVLDDEGQYVMCPV